MSSGPVRAGQAQLWHLIDGRGEIVGRLATHVSRLLMGKHKPYFSPHADMGDNVVLVNAKDLVLTGKKYEDKLYRWHTGYPGGLKSATPRFLTERKGRPEEIFERAVNGMLPKNKLRKRRMERLRVFAGDAHPFMEMFSAEQLAEFNARLEAPTSFSRDFNIYPDIERVLTEEDFASHQAEAEAFFAKELGNKESITPEEAQKSIEEMIENAEKWRQRKRW